MTSRTSRPFALLFCLLPSHCEWQSGPHHCKTKKKERGRERRRRGGNEEVGEGNEDEMIEVENVEKQEGRCEEQ